MTHMPDDSKKVELFAAGGSLSVVSSSAALTIGPVLRAYSRPPDNHPIYHVIGQVAAEWSALEHILDQVIWELLGPPTEQGACITSQLMGVGPRCRAIIAQLTFGKRKPEI